MLTGLLLGIFIAIYSIAEGVTEGKYWETVSLLVNSAVSATPSSIAELQGLLIKKKTSIAKYHFWRALEILGFLAISITVYFIYAGFTTESIFLGFCYLFGGICWGILVYRIAFIKTRKQITISPVWEWAIYLPGIGIKSIAYPPAYMFYLTGTLGMFILLFSRYLVSALL